MSTKGKLVRRVLPALGLTGALTVGLLNPADASSHREAPLISEDPAADLTDVYAFVSPDDKNTLTIVANVNPFESPAGGPNFYRFADDVLYQLNVDSDGDAIADKEYEFRFTTTTRNGNTFLYNTGQVTSLDDADLNVRQSYSVTEVARDHKGRTTRKVLGANLPVPPVNVGKRSMPNYDADLAAPAVKAIEGGVKAFAGPRDDPFFVDLGQIFDLGGLGPFLPAHLIPSAAVAGEDYVAGANVHTFSLQIPISRLVENGDPVVGVWASTFRRAERVLGGNGTVRQEGRWVQVSRLGQPLVNEVVIPRGMKDKFNASKPNFDSQFAASVLNPELANLIPVLYPGVKVPTNVDAGLGLGGREDIATIFLTGIPGVNKPKHVKPSEMLRVNTSIADSHFPNGRELADDVTDTEIRALAGATPFTPEFNISPNKDLGDGVDANDRSFMAAFPYLASPNEV
jgi:hypothetical protein